MYISINEPAKIILYERIGSAAGPKTVAKYTQRRIDGVNSATPYRKLKLKKKKTKHKLPRLDSLEMYTFYLFDPNNRKNKAAEILQWTYINGLLHLQIQLNAHFSFERYTQFLKWNAKQLIKLNFTPMREGWNVRCSRAKLPAGFWSTIRVSIYLV